MLLACDAAGTFKKTTRIFSFLNFALRYLPTKLKVERQSTEEQVGRWKQDLFHSCTVHLDTIKVFYLPTDTL
jgi:hypothetical protein